MKRFSKTRCLAHKGPLFTLVLSSLIIMSEQNVFFYIFFFFLNPNLSFSLLGWKT